MKNLLQILLYTIFYLSSFGQVNLVVNPSFENLSSCPSNFAQISRAIGWDTLRNGGGITPDLYNTCYTGPLNWCSVPVNWWDGKNFLYPKSGNGYAGFVALYGSPQVRELIQGSLVHKLILNNDYCIKAHFNLSDFSKYSINSIGFYLDDGDINCQGHNLPNIIPQVFHTGYQLNDTAIWMRIEGIFTANGTEEYITIGNFFPDSLSSPVLFKPSGTLASYYYVDDVSVIDANLPAYAGNDTLIQQGDSVFIGRQPEIGLDEDCIWLVNGVPLDTVAGLWVQPDTTTTYIVQQTICGNVKWDTVTVSVDTGVGMAAFELDKRVKVYPNPATHQLTIESPITNATLCITNLLGQEVWRQEVREKSFSVDVSGLGKGVYFVYMKTEKGVVAKKFMKE